MPLKKQCSMKAFQWNVNHKRKKGEPPSKQDMAIAYSVLKKACGVKSGEDMKPSDIIAFKKEEMSLSDLIDSLNEAKKKPELKIKSANDLALKIEKVIKKHFPKSKEKKPTKTIKKIDDYIDTGKAPKIAKMYKENSIFGLDSTLLEDLETLAPIERK
jgi:hypothetical protein